MSFFADSLPFESQTRMTSVWRQAREDEIFDDHVVTIHLITLGDDQDGELEGSFLTRFLPFHTGGFSGVDPHGRPWLVVIQHRPVESSSLLIQDEGPYWPLQASMKRAISFNDEARVVVSLSLTRLDLQCAYDEDALASSRARGWLTSELVYGLLAQMCGASLHDLASGYVKKCAFPEEDHDCEEDVFLDVFARWRARRMPVHE
jgi:hypothetical protein